MKLPLLLLCFVFCFPAFGQVVDSVDWSTKDFPRVKVPKRKFKGPNSVYYNIEYNGLSMESEHFPNAFKRTLDTIYQSNTLHKGGIGWRDTFYIKRIADFIDDKGNADIQYFYPNGQLEKRVNYVSTEEGGTFEYQYPRRTKDTIVYEPRMYTHHNGVANGIIKYYYPTGQIEKIEEYDKGILNGKFYSYYRNGQVKEEREYKLNCPIGTWQVWHENGQLASIFQYENCQLFDTIYSWYENGQLAEIKQFKHGLPSGETKVFYDDGSLKVVGNYRIFENEKSEEVLRKEALEQIKKYSGNIGPGNRTRRSGWVLNNYDTLARVKEMVQLEKYKYQPFGEFNIFDTNGDVLFRETFKKKIDTEHLSFHAALSQADKKIQRKYFVKRLFRKKYVDKYLALKKATKSLKEENINNECLREVQHYLPFRVRKNRELHFCISDLEIGIPNESEIEIFPPFGEEYEFFTQVITLKNVEGDLKYLLKYPSGQIFLDYDLNCKDFFSNDSEIGYITSSSASYLYSNLIKVYHRNGQIKHEAVYKRKLQNQEDYPQSPILLEFKDFTQSGKLLVDYSHRHYSKNHGEVYDYNIKYFYDDKEKLLGSHLYFDKDKQKWQEITLFHPNGNIKKKITKKDSKLHNWQELYNEAGELIAKEKFEEGKSVEFIKY